MRGICSFLFVMMSYLQTYAQCAQVGNKLIGTGALGEAYQGYSVSISSDGKTALIGGHYDNSNQGAIWIFTLNGNNFIQLGNKLVANDASGDHPFQGASVSLSADGKTALVGGNQDNFHIGAAWIYTFNGSNYVQLGSKLIGNDATGTSIYQGGSVSLSEDGRTAMIGGTGDNSDQGAAWIYTLSGNSFKQVGNKLVGTNAIGTAEQGYSVSLSSDGKTALMGGAYDNTGVGAAWVFTFNGVNYVQAGDKLVISNTGPAQIGTSVSLSADGKTAAIGGLYNLVGLGAVWIFTFNGTNFIEFDQLSGTDVSERPVYQGCSVSLSYDGKTVLVGGYKDNSGHGAAWIYTFNGHNFVQAGNKFVGSDTIGPAGQGRSVSISGDGKTALVGGYNDNFNQGAVWVYYCSSIQDPTSILDFSELENRSVCFDVFPNPSYGTFTIKQSEALRGKPLIVEIYNNLGKRIKTVSEGETNLSSGFYLLRSGMYSKKLIIE